MIPVFALLLDALIGDPKSLWSKIPHPAVMMGKLIDWADQRFNDDDDDEATRKVNGILVCLGLVASMFALALIICSLPLGWYISVFVGAFLLAQRSLIQHVQAVADALRMSTADARIMVGRIVGRDTNGMSREGVARSAIESAAENFSDGLVAPLFWFVVAGLPGLLIYKIVNTADSMIGYRTPRHNSFGWACARLDDVLNWIPARLTALIILLAARVTAKFTDIRTDAIKHRSPNAGWPEAAMARALGVALAGPRSYEGEMRDFPWVNEQGRQNANEADIEAACLVLWKSWAIVLAGALVVAMIRAIC
ncbi:adenosylcobinamide-phosphate synthase CbiB [Halocynthiibacter namhaensis]|uniref:adenosylcobinamide-phosphate synthase CbiB n=1 Tax=Halocynthiibacter namhaensis TaxID=1290553 RepID=UPI0005797C75|nr:adenosylcobinamide-phosphate synthase CbiB [Halocynthiibacter namhaensis]